MPISNESSVSNKGLLLFDEGCVVSALTVNWTQPRVAGKSLRGLGLACGDGCAGGEGVVAVGRTSALFLTIVCECSCLR